MNKSMNKSFSAIALIITFSATIATSAYADNQKRADLKAKHTKIERHSGEINKVRSTPKGDISRHVVQTVNDNGFTRTITKTNPEGQTATRVINVVNDPETGTHTRSMEGTTMNGKTIARSSVMNIDKENHTMTKDVSVTLPSGEVKNHHVEANLKIKDVKVVDEAIE